MSTEKRNRIIAICATVSVHVVVVVLLFLLALTTPLPLPGEAGVEVDFGTDEQSAVTEQPANTEETVKQPTPQPEPEPEPESEQVEDPVVTQDTEETVDIEPEKTKEPEKPKEPEIIKKALFPPQPQNVNPQEHQETEEKPETIDPGKTIGSESPNTTTPGGTGINTKYDLGGRNHIGNLPAPTISSTYNTQGEHKLVIKIWVDKNGQVTKAEKTKGGIIDNPDMVANAIKAAKATRFEPDEDALDEQIGYITYTINIGQ